MRTGPLIRLARAKGSKHVVVLGCGNIGSFLLLLLVRMAEIGKLTLVDFDSYEEKNVWSQQTTPADFAKPKALALARLARRLSPRRLAVVPIVARLEDVPLGMLRSDVMLACLDSKAARLSANEIAWHLGVPLIDAGVEASGSLARVNVYVPAPDQPCLQCGWDERDYTQLPVKHPCNANNHATPSGAPACLGALAASLQAIECKKTLAGDFRSAGKQILIAAATHKHFVTTFRPNPNCRFSHETWQISKRRASPTLSVNQALRLSGSSPTNLGFGGMHLARQIACPACGFARCVWRLESRLAERDRICPRCNRELLSSGFQCLSRVHSSDVDSALAALSLARLGLRNGDIISISSGTSEEFFELTAPRVGHRRTI